MLSMLVTGAVVVGVVLAAPPRESGVRQPVTRPEAASATVRAVAVLHAWDRRRAAAWADDDTMALQAIYMPGSSAGRHDVTMLEAYGRRGFRVTRMQRQVMAVRVRAATSTALTLVVTDRLAEARVTRHGVTTVLPRSRPATRRIALRRVASGWRVAEVYDD